MQKLFMKAVISLLVDMAQYSVDLSSLSRNLARRRDRPLQLYKRTWAEIHMVNTNLPIDLPLFVEGRDTAIASKCNYIVIFRLWQMMPQ